MWKLAANSRGSVVSLNRKMFSTTSAAHWDRKVKEKLKYYIFNFNSF